MIEAFIAKPSAASPAEADAVVQSRPRQAASDGVSADAIAKILNHRRVIIATMALAGIILHLSLRFASHAGAGAVSFPLWCVLIAAGEFRKKLGMNRTVPFSSLTTDG
jgi:hypothetical protein